MMVSSTNGETRVTDLLNCNQTLGSIFLAPEVRAVDVLVLVLRPRALKMKKSGRDDA